MVFGINLPDFKGSLNEAFANYVQTPLETKAAEIQKQLEQKSQEFKQQTFNFQQAIIAILFASFCVGVITVTWKE